MQRAVGAALDGWLSRRPGRVRVRLRPAGDALELHIDAPDTPDIAPENMSLDLAPSVRRSE